MQSCILSYTLLWCCTTLICTWYLLTGILENTFQDNICCILIILLTNYVINYSDAVQRFFVRKYWGLNSATGWDNSLLWWIQLSIYMIRNNMIIMQIKTWRMAFYEFRNKVSDRSYAMTYPKLLWILLNIIKVIIPPETKFRGGILDSPCSSVRPSVRLFVRPWVGVRMITLILFSGF